MLYLIYGSDQQKRKQQYEKILSDLSRTMNTGAPLRMDASSFDQAVIEEYARGTKLFSGTSVFIIDAVIKNEEIFSFLSKLLPACVASDSAFIFLEEKVNKDVIEKFKKAKVVILEEAVQRADKKMAFNIFTLADAFGSRDKKNAWVLYERAQIENLSPEEIHGVLFWQVKNILIAKKDGSAGGGGMSPFAYSKAKTFAKNFEVDELERISKNLISISHEAHRGLRDFAVSLEELILTEL